jgi:hypothetical protein
MTWNYRIIKRGLKNEPEYYYALNEVFYKKNGKPLAFGDADSIVGNSPEEIIESLEIMLADAKKDQPILTEEDFKPL